MSSSNKVLSCFSIMVVNFMLSHTDPCMMTSLTRIRFVSLLFTFMAIWAVLFSRYRRLSVSFVIPASYRALIAACSRMLSKPFSMSVILICMGGNLPLITEFVNAIRTYIYIVSHIYVLPSSNITIFEALVDHNCNFANK